MNMLFFKKELYLKQKYDPKLFNSTYSIYNVDSNPLNKCIFLSLGFNHSSSKQSSQLSSSDLTNRCNKTTLPTSKYCQERMFFFIYIQVRYHFLKSEKS